VKTGCAVAAALLLWSAPAPAGDVVLKGQFVQGGLVEGRVPAGTKVNFDGRELRVGRDGVFLIGFGREAGGGTLVLTHADGRRETRALAVEKRSWQVQRVDGVPQQTVTPNEEELQRIRAEAALARGARQVDSAEPLFRTGFVWPVIGPISGVYGSQRILNGEPRAPHRGIDVAAPPGRTCTGASTGSIGRWTRRSWSGPCRNPLVKPSL
jgi:hypothetical protein